MKIVSINDIPVYKNLGNGKFILKQEFPIGEIILMMVLSIIPLGLMLFFNLLSIENLPFLFAWVVFTLIILYLLIYSCYRKKILFTESEVNIFYYFIIIPFYRKSFPKSEIELSLYSKGKHIEKIARHNNDRFQIKIVKDAFTLSIREFRYGPTYYDKEYLKILQKHKIPMDHSVRKLLE